MAKNELWIKTVPIVISVTALLFSFGTTYVSLKHTKSQDIQNLRTELRGLLQRLATLPQDNFELTAKYKNDPASVAWLSSYINQENALLSRQAAELSRKIPTDQVSPTEYYAIGLALQQSYDINGAMEFMKRAIDSSNDFNDEIAALRTYGNLLFMSGKPEEGRAEFQKALNIFLKYKNYPDFVQNAAHITTELNWAAAEASIQSKELCEQHLANAENYLLALSSSPGKEQLKNQIAQERLLLSSQSSSSNNILGEWAIRYSSANRSGKAVFVPNQMTGGYSVSVDIFEDGELRYKYGGNIISPDLKTIKIDWQGGGCFDAGHCGQLVGTDLLRLTKKNEYIGQQSIVGLKTQTIKMYRTK